MIFAFVVHVCVPGPNSAVWPLLLLRALGILVAALLLCARLLGSFLHGSGLGAIVLAHRLHDRLLLFRLDDGDGIWQGLVGSALALGIRSPHNLDFDAEYTLAQEDVTGGRVDEILGGLTRVDHEAVGELHALGTRCSQLTRDDNFATLGARLHDESEHTIASTTDGETIEQLVPQRFALCDGRETTILHLCRVERHAVFGELETLLDERCEFADATTLLAKNFLGVCGCSTLDGGCCVGDTGVPRMMISVTCECQ